MRFVFAVLLVAAGGCDSSSSNNNSGLDHGVSTDMATAGNGRDLSMSSGGCDVGAGTGCATTEKCIALFNSDNTVSGTCVPNGTIAEGQPCQQTSDDTELNDNCVAGTSCDNDGPDSAFVCRKLCTSNSACTTTGQKCFAFYDPSWGFCLPTCTPFSTNECPAGNDCSSTNYNDIAATDMDFTGYFICKKSGTGVAGASCNFDDDCAAGLWCDTSAGCTPACDNGHPCSPPGVDGGTLSCQPYSNLPNGAGYCG